MSAVRPDLPALLRLTGGPPLTRFAPSPTGYLHLGHVVNAIYVWGVARAAGGRVVLRLEDHDRLRCRPLYEAALLEDLDWLGFVADEGRTPPARQTDHTAAFESALAVLDREGRVYACECSRRQIGPAAYDGRCRELGLAREPGRGLRVRMDGEPVRAHDVVLGSIQERPAAESGDLLVRDRDGHWTYQFAVTVDDTRQGITLVVRGADLVTSTPRQVALAGLLGRAVPPVYLHHPLVMHPDGRKLSKSSGETGTRALRERGLDAGAMIGLAAAAVGLIEAPRPLPAGDVPSLFAGSGAGRRQRH